MGKDSRNCSYSVGSGSQPSNQEGSRASRSPRVDHHSLASSVRPTAAKPMVKYLPSSSMSIALTTQLPGQLSPQTPQQLQKDRKNPLQCASFHFLICYEHVPASVRASENYKFIGRTGWSRAIIISSVWSIWCSMNSLTFTASLVSSRLIYSIYYFYFELFDHFDRLRLPLDIHCKQFFLGQPIKWSHF